MPSPLTRLPPWDRATGHLHVLVDTPGGSRTKFKFDLRKGVYRPAHVLPPGLAFPFDFGSVPGTVAEDGDPLDALVLTEAPSFPGCLVEVRLLGVLAAEQTQKRKKFRNDRLVGAAVESRTYEDWADLAEVPRKLIEQIEGFFVFYNEARGRRFEVLGRYGPDRARRLIAAAGRRFRDGRS